MPRIHVRFLLISIAAVALLVFSIISYHGFINGHIQNTSTKPKPEPTSIPQTNISTNVSKVFPIDYQFKESPADIASDLAYDKSITDLYYSNNTNTILSNLERQDLIAVARKSAMAMEQAKNIKLIQELYNPQISCLKPISLGLGDRDHYTVCNPWVLINNTKPCVMYSFGVLGGEWVNFEQDFYNITGRGCDIFIFDEHEEDPEIFRPFKGKYMKALISSKTDLTKGHYSILDLTKKFGHKNIEILKVDIEGWEFSALPTFLREFNGTLCQILLEPHNNDNSETKILLDLFKMLERRGFRLFDREFTIYPYCSIPWLYQYSYIHLSCMEKYGLSPDSVLFRYFDKLKSTLE